MLQPLDFEVGVCDTISMKNETTMTATYQRNLLDQGYNGWENWETFNVALWVQNDEGLYDLARNFTNYDDLVTVLYGEFGVKETRDGVKFADPKVNRLELNKVLADL